MASNVEQIKSRLSIADVVGSYVKLEKAGANFRARCPFHNERTPSFYVSPARESWHCFGCNRGGDLFSFVQEIEGIEFVDALRMLADRAHVTLSYDRPQERSERDRLTGLLHEAVVFYESVLANASAARAYLESRGVLPDTIKSFRIGFAPASWRGLSDALCARGYRDEEIARAGLSIKSERGGTYYDRFRSRIMFPLANASGVIVGFSGRIFLEPSTTTANGAADQAKYINTPQTLLYDKSKVLFGFERAKNAIRSAGHAVLVEGQMDLVMSHQAGIAHTVAVSGTALTEDHLRLVKRFAPAVVMAFDPDDAGIKAASRAAHLAFGLGLDVRMVYHGRPEDPADMIRTNKTAWLEAVERAEPAVTFFLKHLRGRHTDDRAFRGAVESTVIPIILQIESRIERAQSIADVARALGVDEAPVWDEVRRRAATMSGPTARPAAEVHGAPRSPHVRRNAIEERLFGLITARGLSLEMFRSVAGEDRFAYYDALPDAEKVRLTFAAELAYQGCAEEFLESEMSTLTDALAEENLKYALAERMAELRRAEQAGKQDRVEELLKQCRDITQELQGRKNASAQKNI